jgi:serine/threonine-protein kinase
VDGRYRVVRVLGKWSIGTAYLVTESPSGVERALFALAIAPGREAAWLDWVRAELARLRPVQADGLLAALAGGVATELGGYLVVKRPRGASLQQAIKKDGPLSVQRAVTLAESLARTVAAAHRGGLVLGDLRPSVVLYDKSEKTGVSLLDLGVGRGLAEYLVQGPDVSPSYRSPGRRAGAPAGTADDIYALGAMLFFALTGQPPEPDAGQGRRVVTPPSWVRPDLAISPYVDPVVLRAMAPRPQDRFRTADEMLEALAGVREVFALPAAARELLGLPAGDAGFGHEPTSPYLLHEMLGVPEGPPNPFATPDHKTIELDPSELVPEEER